MATTTDVAPNRSTPAPRRAAASSRRAPASRSNREPDLEAQIEKLQADLKGIAGTLASLAESKVEDAQGMAKRELKNLKTQGQNAVEDVQDEFGQLERQLKDTIREKPLTAVAGAIALGFILAVVSR